MTVGDDYDGSRWSLMVGNEEGRRRPAAASASWLRSALVVDSPQPSAMVVDGLGRSVTVGDRQGLSATVYDGQSIIL